MTSNNIQKYDPSFKCIKCLAGSLEGTITCTEEKTVANPPIAQPCLTSNLPDLKAMKPNCRQMLEVRPSTLYLQESQLVSKKVAFWEEKVRNEANECPTEDMVEDEITKFAQERSETTIHHGSTKAREVEVQTEEVVVIQKYVTTTAHASLPVITHGNFSNVKTSTVHPAQNEMARPEKKVEHIGEQEIESSCVSSCKEENTRKKYSVEKDALFSENPSTCLNHSIDKTAELLQDCRDSFDVNDKNISGCCTEIMKSRPENPMFMLPENLPYPCLKVTQREQKNVTQKQSTAASCNMFHTKEVKADTEHSIWDEFIGIMPSSYNGKRIEKSAPHVKKNCTQRNHNTMDSEHKGYESDSSFLSCADTNYGIHHKKPDSNPKNEDDRILQNLSQEFDSLVVEKNVSSQLVVSSTSKTVLSKSMNDKSMAKSTKVKEVASYHHELQVTRQNCEEYRTVICKKCGERILEDSYTATGGHFWHKNHFTCTFCKSPLIDTTYAIENITSSKHTEPKPFCFPCHKQLFVRVGESI